MHVLPNHGVAPERPRSFLVHLLESRRESPSVMTFRFSTGGTGFQYRSNQAVRLLLPGVDDPWGAARTLSLSSSPSEPEEIAVTCKITDTPFKQALARLEPGAPAQVIGPLGDFLLDTTRPGIFVAGGIGVTPFRGMFRFAADTGIQQPMILLYSARVPEELVFREELDALVRAHPNLSVQYTVTRPKDSRAAWNGRVGRIDANWIESFSAGLPGPKFYVAGLPEMVGEIVTTLQGSGRVPPENIEHEMFRGF